MIAESFDYALQGQDLSAAQVQQAPRAIINERISDIRMWTHNHTTIQIIRNQRKGSFIYFYSLPKL